MDLLKHFIPLPPLAAPAKPPGEGARYRLDGIGAHAAILPPILPRAVQRGGALKSGMGDDLCRTSVRCSPERSVFADGIPPDVDSLRLRRLFASAGKVRRVRVLSRHSGKRYAFVEYASRRGALRAMEEGALVAGKLPGMDIRPVNPSAR